jgi:hypothetical protein
LAKMARPTTPTATAVAVDTPAIAPADSCSSS